MNGKTVGLLLLVLMVLMAMIACRGSAGLVEEEQMRNQAFTAPAEWLNGINLPWISFGNDFGGDADSPAKMKAAFSAFQEAGINSVRIWIHCDGRASPLFEKPGGKVTGLPEGFLDDFEDMLDAAQQHGILVMPVLWSFDMVKDRTNESGPYAGVQKNLLLKDDHLESYIEKALIPLLKRCDRHPAMFAWEICNEPEWMVQDSGLPKKRVQRFHAHIAAAIHEHGTKPVTTGSASIKWSTDALPVAIGNWWSDKALKKAYSDPKAYLDFYQLHVYAWMLEHGYDPYIHTPESLKLDKPVMIGEAPGQHMGGYDPVDMLERARSKGYFGHYFWSYAANDGAGDWEQIKAALPKNEAP